MKAWMGTKGYNLNCWIAAWLTAVVTPALLVTLFSLDPSTFLPTLAVSVAHAIFPGLVVVLVYWWRRWRRPSAALLGGFLIGLAPWAIISWPGPAAAPNGLPFGMAEAAGSWHDQFLVLGSLGALGACGAVAFWAVLRVTGQLGENLRESAHAQKVPVLMMKKER